jgi:DnaK suppressor protein
MKSGSSENTKLTESQLARLKSLLEAKRLELTAREASVRASVGANSADPADPSEQASDDQEETEKIGEVRSQENVLADVNAALKKLALGTYGISEESGEPIGFARLEAVPWARRTVEEENE